MHVCSKCNTLAIPCKKPYSTGATTFAENTPKKKALRITPFLVIRMVCVKVWVVVIPAGTENTSRRCTTVSYFGVLWGRKVVL